MPSKGEGNEKIHIFAVSCDFCVSRLFRRSCTGGCQKSSFAKKGAVTRVIPHKLFIHQWMEKMQPFTDHLNPITHKWEGGTYYVEERNGNVAEKKFFESLRDQGYLRLENYQEVARSSYDGKVYMKDDYYIIHYTDKLAPFIYGDNADHMEIIIAQTTVDEITGIVKADENGREVKFRTRTDCTEIGKYYNPETYELEPRNHSAYFRKYDDGWRLEG